MTDPARRKPSKVALVTGASSGIGRVFAGRLAAAGYDLTVVARREDALQEQAARLATRTGVTVDVFAADLADRDQRGRVEAHLRERADLTLLVNSAGFGSTGPFVEQDLERETQQIELNVVALARLTHAALAPMIARGKGSIINVSSVAGFQPGPLNATYSAAKAYVTSFTEALYEEVRGTGVRVQALCPGFTRTDFQASAGWSASSVPSFAWMTAEQVVDESLRCLRQGRAVCIPGLQNKALAASTHMVPRAVVRRLSGIVSHRAVTRDS